jgi:biofilm PGA synthesis protein PgaA
MSRIAIYIVSILFSLSYLFATDYDEIIKMARNGQYEKALKYLKEFHASHPEDMKILSDYITVLGWAQRDEEVVTLAEQNDMRRLPYYTLEVVAKAYRNLNRFDEAEHTYKLCLEKKSDDFNCELGIIATLLDRKRFQEALKALASLKERYAKRSELFVYEGLAYEGLGRYFEAFRAFQRAYETDPDNQEALQGYVRALDNLGMPQVALEYARRGKVPEIFYKKLLKDRLAFGLRWAELYAYIHNHKKDRFKEIDGILCELDNFIANYKGDDYVLLQARYDRVVAMRDRFYMKRVLKEYENFLKEKRDIPAYVLNAVADAYLYEKEPEKALQCYWEALKKDPDNFNSKIGVFFSKVELFKLDEAIEWIDKVDREEKPWIKKRFKNKRKLTTYILSRLARYYADYMDEAQELFEKAVYVAPANMDLRVELANIYHARGLDRAALKELNIVQNYEPHHRGAAMLRAETAFSMRKYRTAEKLLQKLYENFPEDLRVRKAKKSFDIYKTKMELVVTGSMGSSSSKELGSDHYAIESRLYSKPIDYNYRVFLLTRHSGADLLEGNQHYSGYGAGVEFRKSSLLTNVGIMKNYQKDDGSFFADIRYSFDDHWYAAAAYDSYSKETPLRALRHDIKADRKSLEVGYRANESRSTAVQIARMDFEDDNVRKLLLVNHFERLVSGPYYKLDATFSYSTSSNTKENRPYFNPKRDRYFGASFENIMPLYRRYANSFTHVFGFNVGSYRQKGYGTDPVGALWYEHRWSYENVFDLDYGVKRSKMYFDGSKEYDTTFYFTLDWRF